MQEIAYSMREDNGCVHETRDMLRDMPHDDLSNVIQNKKLRFGENLSAAISQVWQNLLQLIRLGKSNDADGFGKQKTGVAVYVVFVCHASPANL